MTGVAPHHTDSSRVGTESLKRYLLEVRSYPRLDSSQETQLLSGIRSGERTALQPLIRAHLRTVVVIARRYQNQGLSLADLINAGNRGLLRATQHFDGCPDGTFMPYALCCIRQAILFALRQPLQASPALPISGASLPKPVRPSAVLPAPPFAGPALEQDSREEDVSETAHKEDDRCLENDSGQRSPQSEDGETDLVLMARVRDGDQDSFRLLLQRHWSALVAYAARFTAGPDQAEDVVQDTFVRVWRQRESWTPSGAVGAYLYRITRNLALNARRDRKAQERREEHGGQEMMLFAASRSGPAEDLAMESLREQVEGAIAKLPERRQEVFILSRYHGLTHQEIADTIGVSRQTVANHMSAALSDLRTALADHLREE